MDGSGMFWISMSIGLLQGASFNTTPFQGTLFVTTTYPPNFPRPKGCSSGVGRAWPGVYPFESCQASNYPLKRRETESICIIISWNWGWQTNFMATSSAVTVFWPVVPSPSPLDREEHAASLGLKRWHQKVAMKNQVQLTYSYCSYFHAIRPQTPEIVVAQEAAIDDISPVPEFRPAPDLMILMHEKRCP